MNTLPVELRVRLTRWLTPMAALHLLITALEYGDPETATALQLHNAAVYPLARHHTSQAVQTAASLGCLRAVATLLSPSSCRVVPSNKLREYVALVLSQKLPVWVLHDAIRYCEDDTYVQWLSTQCHPSDDPASILQLTASRRRLPLFRWLADRFSSTTRPSSITVRVLAPLDPGVDYVCCVVTSPLDDDGVRVRSLFADLANGLAPVVSYSVYGGLAPPLYPAMDHAAAIGDLLLLQRLHEDPRFSWPCTTRAMDAAATSGRLDIVQWLHSNREEGCSHAAMDGAARNGHFELVKWLYYFRQEKGSAQAYDLAAEGGHLRVLRWQRTRFVGFKLSTAALETAAKRGRLETLQWVDETHARVEITVAMVQNTVNGGHLQLLQWLMGKLQAENKSPRAFLQSHFIAESAGRKNLLLLQWLWLEFALISHDALHHAVLSGYMEVVHWLLGVLPVEEQGLRSDTLWRLAAEGQWAVLEWLLETKPQLCERCELLTDGQLGRFGRKTPATKWLPQYTRLVLRHLPDKCLREPLVPAWAARRSLVDIVDGLLAHGHPCFAFKRIVHALVRSSASSKASKVFETILSQHPDWYSTRVVQWAATYSHTGLLTFLLRQHTARSVAILRSTLFTACRHDLTAVVDWVHHNPLETSTNIDLWRGCALAAARHDSLLVLRWLEDHNCIRESSGEIVSAAVGCGSVGVMKWLLQRTPKTSFPIEINAPDVNKAIRRGHVGVVAWLHEQCSSTTIKVSTPAIQREIERFLDRWLPVVLLDKRVPQCSQLEQQRVCEDKQ